MNRAISTIVQPIPLMLAAVWLRHGLFLLATNHANSGLRRGSQCERLKECAYRRSHRRHAISCCSFARVI